MPRLPTYADVNQTGLQNTQRVLQGPQPVGISPSVQDNTGEAMAGFGSAVVEITDRIRIAQIENEVRKTDITTQVALEKFKQNLSTIDDENEYEKQWTAGAQKILNEAGNKLTSPMAQRAWKARGDEHFGKGLMDVRDMARKKGVDKTKAGVIELASMADQLQDDPTATDKLRQDAADSAISAMDNLAKRGFVSHEESTRFKVGMQERILKKTQERTQLAQVQQLEDTIWTESGGDYGKASEMVREIKDPVMRDLAQRRVDDRFSNEKRVIDAQQEEAATEVSTVLARGGSLSDVPASTLEKLNPTALLTLQASERAERKAARSEAKQEFKEKSAVFRGGLEAQSYENPTEFAKEGALEAALEKYPLSTSDASALLVRRAQIRGGKAGENLDSQIFKSVKSISGPMLDKYISDDKGKSQPIVAKALDAAILFESRAFAEREKRQPNPKETQEIIAKSVLRLDKGVVSKTGLGAKDGKIIKAPAAAAVPYAIPFADRRAIEATLRKRYPNQEITPQDVRNEYARLLSGKK